MVGSIIIYYYKLLILINILRELFTIKEDFVINSLHSIVMKECSNKYYEEYRSYKHHPREQILRSRIKSIETKYSEFIENFKFLLKEAVAMGYYSPVDYSKNPFLYCGKVKVTNNPYY